MEVKLLEFVKDQIYPGFVLEKADIPEKLRAEYFDYDYDTSNKPGYDSQGRPVVHLERYKCLSNISITFKADDK